MEIEKIFLIEKSLISLPEKGWKIRLLLLVFLGPKERIQHHKRKRKRFLKSRLGPKKCRIILENRRQKFSKLILFLISTERIGKKIFEESPHLQGFYLKLKDIIQLF